MAELNYVTSQGEKLQAVFLPEKGMNLISFKKGDLEIIDQTTKNLFDERFAGLGALIGPHFHHRKSETIPLIKDEILFPHIARVKAKGIKEPFSHGIARYAPWTSEATPNIIKGRITGKDKWNGIPLAELEGQNFNMNFEAQLGEKGLSLNLSVVSDSDSLVGIHYYYALPNGKGRIISQVQNLQSLPSDFQLDSHQRLEFDLSHEADYTFHPFPDPLRGHIVLETEKYTLYTTYQCNNAENCWQLYHPQDASFVCIEPLSAKDPRHPNLTVSSIQIHLDIQPPRS